jgi:hypothetical protein
MGRFVMERFVCAPIIINKGHCFGVGEAQVPSQSGQTRIGQKIPSVHQGCI